MALGYPHLDNDEGAIKVVRPANEKPPYDSFADFHAKVRSQDRDAEALAEGVARARVTEEKARTLSREQDAENFINHLVASGRYVSSDQIEAIRAQAKAPPARITARVQNAAPISDELQAQLDKVGNRQS